MFDRICCRSMHQAERPLVNCGALLELKSLLASADGDEGVLEDQHRFPSEEGDAEPGPPSYRRADQQNLFQYL